MNPYFGVTGFSTKKEIESFLDGLKKRKINDQSLYNCLVEKRRKITIGVLASHRTVRGLPPEDKKRYPDISKNRIFISDPLFINTVHYNSQSVDLDLELLALCTILPDIQAIQLNIAWPNPQKLLRFFCLLPKIEFILQIGTRAHASSKQNISELIKMVNQYTGLIKAVLLDLSGGKGKPIILDAETLVFLQQIEEEFNRGLIPAIAGGFSAETMEMIEPANHIFKRPKERFQPSLLSIDAESLLRTDNELDIEKSVNYIEAAFRCFYL